MSDAADQAIIGAAVAEVVQDAAEQAAEDVREAAAVEQAAEAVEQAAEHVEQAAQQHELAATDHHLALGPDDVRNIIREELAATQATPEAITHEHAVEVAEVAAESAVEQIVEAAQEATEGGDGTELPEVELPGDQPAEAVESVADVIDQAADEAPRKRHWMHRAVLGGRG